MKKKKNTLPNAHGIDQVTTKYSITRLIAYSANSFGAKTMTTQTIRRLEIFKTPTITKCQNLLHLN